MSYPAHNIPVVSLEAESATGSQSRIWLDRLAHCQTTTFWKIEYSPIFAHRWFAAHSLPSLKCIHNCSKK